MMTYMTTQKKTEDNAQFNTGYDDTPNYFGEAESIFVI